MNSSAEHKTQLLVILSRFPYPLEKGDKLRAFYQLQELSKQFEVTLCAISDRPVTNEQIAAVKPYCVDLHVFRIKSTSRALQLVTALFTSQPFQVAYFHNWLVHRKIGKIIKTNHFDHIYCQLIRTTEYVKNIHHIPKTLDYMDALSAGIQRRIQEQPWYKKWIFKSEHKRLKKYERSIFDYFENHTIISEQDRKLILHPSNMDIQIVPNGVHNSFFETPNLEKTHDIVFVGNMSYAPNVSAVQFFKDKITSAHPEWKILISGSSPDAKVVQIGKTTPQITITGWVDDIRTSYAQGKIFVAPMFIGTGMQNKLLEAMALAIPCVTTPLANNAIHAIHGKHIMVGNNAHELIEHISFLLNNPEEALKIGEEGSKFVAEHYSWKKSVEILSNLFEQ